MQDNSIYDNRFGKTQNQMDVPQSEQYVDQPINLQLQSSEGDNQFPNGFSFDTRNHLSYDHGGDEVPDNIQLDADIISP